MSKRGERAAQRARRNSDARVLRKSVPLPEQGSSEVEGSAGSKRRRALSTRGERAAQRARRNSDGLVSQGQREERKRKRAQPHVAGRARVRPEEGHPAATAPLQVCL